MMMTSPWLPGTLALLLGVPALVMGSPAGADPLTEAQARAIIVPFYNALNATSGNDVPAMMSRQ